jgi:hypothetical protein
MKYLIFLCFSLFAVTSNASAPVNTCADPNVNRQWQDALETYPNDRLLLKLSSLRSGLCEMIENDKMDVHTAKLTWEQALTTALLERAREDQSRRGLMRLFGTF